MQNENEITTNCVLIHIKVQTNQRLRKHRYNNEHGRLLHKSSSKFIYYTSFAHLHCFVTSMMFAFSVQNSSATFKKQRGSTSLVGW